MEQFKIVLLRTLMPWGRCSPAVFHAIVYVTVYFVY